MIHASCGIDIFTSNVNFHGIHAKCGSIRDTWEHLAKCSCGFALHINWFWNLLVNKQKKNPRPIYIWEDEVDDFDAIIFLNSPVILAPF